MKKFLSVLLAVSMLFSMTVMAIPAGAEDTTEAIDVTVAEVGDYDALVAAVKEGGSIKLTANIDVTDTITVPAGATVTLDLAGHTISQTKAQTTGYQMILNDGNLTIKDSATGGKISYTDSGNGGDYISDTIYNRSVLVINGGTIENLSSATVASNGYPHAVDNYSGIRNTSLTVNGGTIYCAEYSAIRMFCVSATYKADLVINDGTIKGAVDMQNGTKDAALGSLTINGGTFETTKNANNIRFANWNGGATTYGITASIKGGTFDGGITTAYVPAAANWDSKIITGGTFTTANVSAYVAEGYTLGADGSVEEAVDTVIDTEAELVDAIAVGGEVVLGGDIVLTAPITVTGTVALDLAGYDITLDSTTMGEAMITNKGNLTINDTVDGGVINYNYTGAADSSYSKGNYTICNAGTLTVNDGKITIANLSGHAKYPIDNNSTTGDAILVINGGHLYNYNTSAIRQFCNSTTNENSVTIKGGLIEGYCAIWVQNPSSKTVNGSLSITGGEVKTTAKAYVNGTAAIQDVSSSIYCTIAGEGGAWDDASAVSITGGIINENVYLAEDAPAAITAQGATFNGYVELPVVVDTVDTYEELVAALEVGGEITLGADITADAILVVTNDTVIDGQGYTITYTGSDRAIDVKKETNGANLTISDLTVDCTASYCQRGINYNTTGTLALDNVTVKGTNVTYAVNFPSSANGATVTIENSDISGNIAVNIWGTGMEVDITDTDLTTVDNNSVEGYVALKLNNDSVNSAEGTVVTVTGGSINVTGTAADDSSAYGNATATGAIDISNTTVVNGDESKTVAVVKYEGTDASYGLNTLQGAIDKATNDPKATVVLIKDVVIDAPLTVTGTVTIDLNGYTVTSTAAKAFEIYADATIKNGAIVANDRCVDTRTNVTLNIEDLALSTKGADNNQPITVGGSTNGTVVNATNVTVDAGTAGYALICFVEADITLTDCDFTGYSNIYMKNGSANSTVKVVNSDLTTNNSSTAESASHFAAIVFEDNDITVNVDADSTITVAKLNTASNSVVMVNGTTGHAVTVNADVTLSGGATVLSAETDVTNNNFVFTDAAAIADLEAAGYEVSDAGVVSEKQEEETNNLDVRVINYTSKIWSFEKEAYVNRLGLVGDLDWYNDGDYSTMYYYEAGFIVTLDDGTTKKVPARGNNVYTSITIDNGTYTPATGNKGVFANVVVFTDAELANVKSVQAYASKVTVATATVETLYGAVVEM